MHLRLRNVLKIAEADVELGGLTVIAGENDCGKSTVGKVLFSAVKAFNSAFDIQRDDVRPALRMQVGQIARVFFAHAKYDRSFLNSVNIKLLLDKGISAEEFEAGVMQEAALLNIEGRQLAIIKNCISRIKQFIHILDNPDFALKTEFATIASSEFREPLISFGEVAGSIEFHDDTTDASGSDVNFYLSGAEVTKTIRNGRLSLEDITYIETPLYLHLLNSLRPNRTADIPQSLSSKLGDYGNSPLPYHLIDLSKKVMREDQRPSLFDYGTDINLHQTIANLITGEIEGEFIVDRETNELLFRQGENRIPTLSVASGIKSLGLLMRLVKTNSLSPYSMLIWDEPEIHLHPRWQLVLCKALVELTANGVPVLVTSHSPYFIQGLRYYSAARGIEKSTKFYLAESKEAIGQVKISEVTDDLNRVFSILAAPLRDIMNVAEARQK